MANNGGPMLGRHRYLGRQPGRYWVGRHDPYEVDYEGNGTIRQREKFAWKQDQGLTHGQDRVK